ncbi:polyphosphate polymerase domain-containing protein [Oribacterium sp. WCC10]|uniref:polyphosphate polymerase domain-containing protein n=1 Tax=Oribacterium sp. WCC10 TaxID=1855343 RepID=UPI0008E046B0|nr:polyphosphate polymerase domain-containing protein [Oribacterium sp. WCC10]SFG26093.1 VTC domain-containing protein [Oribacterium sp. WCC10]
MEKPKDIYRNEWKYLISHSEGELLRRRLAPFLHLDKHAKEDGYEIRSLYFDDYKNTAYNQKLMGVYARKKWRIRIYNYSDAKISLERKKKSGSYIFKEMADITREEFERIMAGDYGFLLEKKENLCKEFYVECLTNLLRPKVIVDYKRLPLILDEGTVRITFDSEVAAAVGSFDIFDETLPKLPAIDEGVEVLEVKYTEFLPQIISELLPTDGQEFVAFSKYVSCYDAAHQLTDVTAGISKNCGRFAEKNWHIF